MLPRLSRCTLAVAILTLLALPLVTGCGGGPDGPGSGDDDDTAGDDDDAADDDPGNFDASEAVTGDWSCKGTLGEVTLGEMGELNGLVEDFQDEDPVAGAHVRIWTDNDPTGAVADALETQTGQDGTFNIATGIQACSPFAARIWTDFEPPETYQTFQVNMVVAGSSPFAETFNSVAYSTYQLLPLTVGVETEPGKGIAAGRLTDCAGEPIANAEASVGSVDWDTGEVTEAEGYAMRFFEDEDPSYDQQWTSDDGLFGGMNVPPGVSWNLLAWGIPQDEAHCDTTTGGDTIWHAEGSAYCLLGTTAIHVQPDSVNISNLPLQPYPEACYGGT